MTKKCCECRHNGNGRGTDECIHCIRTANGPSRFKQNTLEEETTVTVSDDVTRLAEWLETATKIAMDKIQAEINAILKEKRHYNSRMHDTTIYTYIAEELLKAGVTLPPEEGENDNARKP